VSDSSTPTKSVSVTLPLTVKPAAPSIDVDPGRSTVSTTVRRTS
jgi:hypothetical protein